MRSEAYDFIWPQGSRRRLLGKYFFVLRSGIPSRMLPTHLECGSRMACQCSIDYGKACPFVPDSMITVARLAAPRLPDRIGTRPRDGIYEIRCEPYGVQRARVTK